VIESSPTRNSPAQNDVDEGVVPIHASDLTHQVLTNVLSIAQEHVEVFVIFRSSNKSFEVFL
jgi:hypothetical protein